MQSVHRSSGSGLQPTHEEQLVLGADLLVLADDVAVGDVGEEHCELFPGD